MTAFGVVFCSYAQEGDTTNLGIGKKNILTVTESGEGTNVNVKEDFMVVDETDDTIKVKLGNKAIAITEEDNEVNVTIIDKDSFEKHGWKKRSDRFKGHWSGFDIGMNNWVNPDFSLAGTTASTDFLELNTGKSWEVDLNFMQYSLPMGRHLGWVTGMGFKWNEYWFEGNNNIMEENGVIVPRVPIDPGVVYEKSKLNTAYLTVPILLETQFGQKGRGYIAAGVIGDLKLSSKTKLKYVQDGTRKKDKVQGDFNLAPLRYHFTARLGYRFIRLFATYSPMQLFKNNTGPEIYPVTVGLTLISFR